MTSIDQAVASVAKSASPASAVLAGLSAHGSVLAGLSAPKSVLAGLSAHESVLAGVAVKVLPIDQKLAKFTAATAGVETLLPKIDTSMLAGLTATIAKAGLIGLGTDYAGISPAAGITARSGAIASLVADSFGGQARLDEMMAPMTASLLATSKAASIGSAFTAMSRITPVLEKIQQAAADLDWTALGDGVEVVPGDVEATDRRPWLTRRSTTPHDLLMAMVVACTIGPVVAASLDVDAVDNLKLWSIIALLVLAYLALQDRIDPKD